MRWEKVHFKCRLKVATDNDDYNNSVVLYDYEMRRCECEVERHGEPYCFARATYKKFIRNPNQRGFITWKGQISYLNVIHAGFE